MSKYKVGYLSQPMIVTEIKRPDPQAVLILKSGETVSLTDAEYNRLIKSEPPLVPPGLLTKVGSEPVEKEPDAVPQAVAEATKETAKKTPATK